MGARGRFLEIRGLAGHDGRIEGLLKRDWVAALLLGAVLALGSSTLVDIDKAWPGPDEFVVGYDARRLLLGEVPYRDFHSIEPPGAIALHALVYRIVGASHLASRVVGAWIAGVIGAIGFLLARRAGASQRLAIAGGAAAALGMFVIWPYPTAHGPAIACALAALLLADGESRYRTAASGFALALAALFHPMFAAPAFIGIALLIGKSLRRWAFFCAGGLFPLLVCALVLAHYGGLANCLHELAWPLSHYHAINRVGYGNEFSVFVHRMHGVSAVLRWILGFVVLAGALIVPGVLLPVVAIAQRRGTPVPRLALATLVTALIVVVGQLFQRPDLFHLAFAAAYFFPACAMLGTLGWPRFVGSAQAAVAAVAGAGLLVASAIGGPVVPRFDSVVEASPELTNLRQLTSPGDRIAVLPAGGFLYSFLRPAALRHTWFFAPSDGALDREDYEEAARDLAEPHTRLVIFMSPTEEQDFLQNAPPMARVLERDFRRQPGTSVWVRR